MERKIPLHFIGAEFFLFVNFYLFYRPTLQFILSVAEVQRRGKHFSLCFA